MAGVIFTHPNPSVGTLNIRLAPKQIDWSFNLNTNKTTTYAGEVIQILSINFDTFSIQGQFGKEGPWGRGFTETGALEPRGVSSRQDYRGGNSPYSVGLTQMTEYFRRYFAVASQGNDSKARGNYDESPMRVIYEGAHDVDRDEGLADGDWRIYPTSFPSFRRSNLDFAPEWKLEANVAEADKNVKRASVEKEIKRLNNVGFQNNFTHFNPFSDPGLAGFGPEGANAKNMTAKQLEALYRKERKYIQEQMYQSLDHFRDLVPAYSDEALEELLSIGASGPFAPTKKKADQQLRETNPALRPGSPRTQ